MSNARKKRKQASYTRHEMNNIRLAPIRKQYIRKIRWMKFIAWLKSLLGVK